MSGSFSSTLRYGALAGWGLTVRYQTTGGEMWRATAVLEAMPLTGGMAFAPIVEGFDLVHDLFVNGGGGHDRQRAVADLLIDNMREALATRDDLGVHAAPWRALVDRYDEAHAEYYARSGNDRDESPGFFEVVGWLFADRATGELVSA